jgi:hypothetical protein
MTTTGSGICADTIISCKKLHSCEKDNLTCSTPNTVCFNNTRCNHPVCYPIERASTHLCPPLTSRTSIISKSSKFSRKNPNIIEDNVTEDIMRVFLFSLVLAAVRNPACSDTQTCVNGHYVGTENFAISATWSAVGDGDIVATTANEKSIYFQNMNATANTDQGTLDRDDTIDTGPENVFWTKDDEPPHGTYHICFEEYRLNTTIENSLIVTIVVRYHVGITETFKKTFSRSI